VAALLGAATIRRGDDDDRGFIITGKVEDSAGRALGSASLEFTPRSGKRSAKAITNAQGEFQVTLVSDGLYRISVRPLPRVLAASVDVEIRKGQTINLEVPDTELLLEIVGAPSDLPLQLFLFDADSRSAGPAVTGILLPQDRTVPIRGLPPGAYIVALDAPPNFVSTSQRIRLSAGIVSRAELRVEAGSTRVKVHDPARNPIAGATLALGPRRVQATTHGEAELVRFAPGVPLIVSADGFLPECVLAPAAGVVGEVTLSPIDRGDLEFIIGPDLRWPIGEVLRDGSPCMFPASLLRSEIVEHIAPSSARVKLMGLQNRQYLFRAFLDAPITHANPGSAPVRIETPEGCHDCNTKGLVEVRLR
jgi:hypothetical protein